jgi:hypothetical protein
VADSSLAPLELLTFAVSLCRHRNRDLRHGLLVYCPANNFIGYESETPFFRSDKVSNGMLEL